MADEKSDEVPKPKSSTEYQAPVIEELVSREALEREVAYAGLPGGTPPP